MSSATGGGTEPSAAGGDGAKYARSPLRGGATVVGVTFRSPNLRSLQAGLDAMGGGGEGGGGCPNKLPFEE